ncbi:Down syndrome cell adhesion molecule-like protein 1 homolog isoform X2 [Sitophilus oryzae]|uniref:Down syndrome cell adhesion molecule-like protein 1 homolog isoform X2 n=1 Tax=Sitophilus oryzae TaxID=7048 RepID=A0A6J2XGB5_SITOR|nr:Down syndrome cell adhesion molecule-like protein 1 homolog isoform X2 [Sitophilus oryzae]
MSNNKFLKHELCRNSDINEISELTNYLPYYSELKIETMRIKAGTPVILKCSPRGEWEYKWCEPSYRGVTCDTKDVTKLEDSIQWRKLRVRDRLDLGVAKSSLNGIYRCVEKRKVRKAVLVEVVDIDTYSGPPPSVTSLKTANITDQLNVEFTIRCNVTSVVPPTIIWFKQCSGHKCDVQYDAICYCHLNESTPVLHLGHMHIGKLSIYNARAFDSGLYACLAVTEYGKDYRNVSIEVPDSEGIVHQRDSSFSLLFLVPLHFVFIPVIVWLCHVRRKRRIAQTEQQKNLLRSHATTSQA